MWPHAVRADMSFWEGIVACGLVDYPSIALADLVEPAPSMQIVSDAVVIEFGDVFGYKKEIETS
jgi:lipoate-protein ligase B